MREQLSRGCSRKSGRADAVGCSWVWMALSSCPSANNPKGYLGPRRGRGREEWADPLRKPPSSCWIWTREAINNNSLVLHYQPKLDSVGTSPGTRVATTDSTRRRAGAAARQAPGRPRDDRPDLTSLAQSPKGGRPDRPRRRRLGPAACLAITISTVWQRDRRAVCLPRVRRVAHKLSIAK